MRQLPLRALVACAIVAIVGVGACNRDDERGGRAESPPERPTPEGPNVVVITTDDQSNHSWRRNVMPNTFELLVDAGTRFRSAIAAPPLCCPSRAGFLTGQYPHNNGVFANEPGYPDLREPKSILPAWLNEAGYTTGFVGKYLNGTTDALNGKPPPGWSSYFQVDDLSYRNATAFDDGERVKLGHAYTPMVLNLEAADFIARESGSRPFFLWLAQTAPHPHNDEDGTCKGKAAQPLPGDLADSQNVPPAALAELRRARRLRQAQRHRSRAAARAGRGAGDREALSMHGWSAAGGRQGRRGHRRGARKEGNSTTP